jgi:hypothetical protein
MIKTNLKVSVKLRIKNVEVELNLDELQHLVNTLNELVSKPGNVPFVPTCPNTPFVVPYPDTTFPKVTYEPNTGGLI